MIIDFMKLPWDQKFQKLKLLSWIQRSNPRDFALSSNEKRFVWHNAVIYTSFVKTLIKFKPKIHTNNVQGHVVSNYLSIGAHIFSKRAFVHVMNRNITEKRSTSLYQSYYGQEIDWKGQENDYSMTQFLCTQSNYRNVIAIILDWGRAKPEIKLIKFIRQAHVNVKILKSRTGCLSPAQLPTFHRILNNCCFEREIIARDSRTRMQGS